MSPHAISSPDLGAPLLVLLRRKPVDNLSLDRFDDRGAAGAVALRKPIRPVIAEADMHAFVARQMLDTLEHRRGQPARAQLEPALAAGSGITLAHNIITHKTHTGVGLAHHRVVG